MDKRPATRDSLMTQSKEDKLLQRLRYLLTKSVVGISKTKQEVSHYGRKETMLGELYDFVDKDGNIEQWLRARCLESVVASAGLNEYLKTLLSFRGSSPGKIAPLNLMFASSQIVRALDPVAVMLLKELINRSKLKLSKQKVDALIAILSPGLDFTVSRDEVYFNVDEVEGLRNLLLEIALKKINIYPAKHLTRLHREFYQLRALGEAPKISLEKLINVSERYSDLNISLSRGILQWKYGTEPTIFVKDDTCFYDQSEVKSKGISYGSVKRQFYLMKETMKEKMEDNSQEKFKEGDRIV